MKLKIFGTYIGLAVFFAPLVMLGTWTGSQTEGYDLVPFFGGMYSRAKGLFQGEGTVPFLVIWALIVVAAVIAEARSGREA